MHGSIVMVYQSQGMYTIVPSHVSTLQIIVHQWRHLNSKYSGSNPANSGYAYVHYHALPKY